MITSSDIQTILYKKAQLLGVKEVYKEGNIMSGNYSTERVVILNNSAEPGIYWRLGFMNVNLCVPDIDRDFTANLTRLSELEALSYDVFKETGKMNGLAYTYEVDSTRIEEDRAAHSHYVNVRILFEVLNVKL